MKLAQIIVLLFFFITVSIFSQSETEVIGVNYSTYQKSNYIFFTSTTQKIDAFVNYGHKIGKKSKLFYHVSYQNFNIDTDMNFDISLQEDIIFLPKIPNYDLLTFATGLENSLKNNWNLTNFITYTIADDFSDDILNNNHYFRTFSFLKKKKSDNLTYGFGVYTDNVKDEFRILPILSLALKNEQQGLKLFFPRSLKIWKKITNKSYVEISSDIDFNTLNTNSQENFNIEIFSVTTNLFYNYIFQKKWKLKTGIGLPYREFEYKLHSDSYKTTQKPAISFNLGLSFVIFQNEDDSN